MKSATEYWVQQQQRQNMLSAAIAGQMTQYRQMQNLQDLQVNRPGGIVHVDRQRDLMNAYNNALSVFGGGLASMGAYGTPAQAAPKAEPRVRSMSKRKRVLD